MRDLQKIYTFEEIIFSRALHCSKENVHLQCPMGEIIGHYIKKRFLLHLGIEPVSTER